MTGSADDDGPILRPKRLAGPLGFLSSISGGRAELMIETR
jgi:hypothetical protein